MSSAKFWLLTASAALSLAPPAAADPNGGGSFNPDINLGGTNGAPAGTVLILCPGVGAGASVLSAGGGWCDYAFERSGAHIHCEWGGWGPVAGGWACWRVWRGRSDHDPQNHIDPDIVPDGSPPRPGALSGPSPEDQAPLGQEPGPFLGGPASP